MTPGRISFNRWLTAGAAAACFLAAAFVAWRAPDEQFWWGGFLRAGVVLVALWACLPTKSRAAAWSDFKPLPTALLLGAAFLAVVRPKVGLPALLAVLAFRWLSNLRRPRATPTSSPSSPVRSRPQLFD